VCPLRLVLLTPMLLPGCSSGNADRAPIEWPKVPGLGPNGRCYPWGPRVASTRSATSPSRPSKMRRLQAVLWRADTALTIPTAQESMASTGASGLATSSDGLHTGLASPAPIPQRNRPSRIGAPGNFDSFLDVSTIRHQRRVALPHVVQRQRRAFNCPNNNLAVKRRIGYAESSDA